jgi:hypothetical protein
MPGQVLLKFLLHVGKYKKEDVFAILQVGIGGEPRLRTAPPNLLLIYSIRYLITTDASAEQVWWIHQACAITFSTPLPSLSPMPVSVRARIYVCFFFIPGTYTFTD